MTRARRGGFAILQAQVWQKNAAPRVCFSLCAPARRQILDSLRNFVGIEVNKTFGAGKKQIIMQPQMRLCISDNLMIGIVTGVPLSRQNERFSTFFRLIYEPLHH